MAIDATVGGTNANSFVTLLEYQAYRTLYYGIDGTEDDLTDEINLMRARRHLDTTYIWKGYKPSGAQPLEWPRVINE